MGWGIRVFLLGRDGHFRRIPHTRYTRLWDVDSKERLPEHAGHEALFLVACLEMEDRRPIRVRGLECRRFRVLDDGQIDVEERERGNRLAFEGVGASLSRRQGENVVSAEHLFIKRRHRREFIWEPTETQLREIQQLIFRD